MAAPTLIEVSVDAEEYSRYEDGRKTITATVVVSGGTPYTNEQIYVDLVKARRGRDAVVATSTLTLNGSGVQEHLVEFFLPNIVDQDLIHLVRHGRYFVRATSVTDEDVVGESADFHVSIVTVERFRSDFLFGIPTISTDIREPKFQPSAITGIVVEEVSPNTPLGGIQLNYLYQRTDTANARAVIGSGVNGMVAIEVDGGGQDGNEYSVVVASGSGNSPLSVVLIGNQLIVSLATTGGVLEPLQNTAELVALAVDALPEFTALHSGSGEDPITSAAEGTIQFSGGMSTILRQISWDGGPLVTITGPGRYVLSSGGDSCGTRKLGLSTNDFIVIRVTSTALLPTENVVETLIIDKQKIDDEALRKYLCSAVSWVEREFLATPVEPTVVVTERDPTVVQYSAGVNAASPIFADSDFDWIVSPLTYFPQKGGTWMFIQTPWPQLLRVDSLYGAIANTRVIDIDLEWIEHSEQGGLIQLVPFNQAVAFSFMGLLWVSALRGMTELPNFWRYRAVVGLREANCSIQELIAKKAAIDALTVLGAALRPGVGSESLSRDGVSQSVSYINSAKYGPYTGAIQAYKDWLEEQKAALKAKYRGANLVVL